MGTGPLALYRRRGPAKVVLLLLTDKENSTLWHDYRNARMIVSETRTIMTEVA
ncbi:hypothetical protein [Rossellomorea aquimaris]|uniref:hypothetical protein n=1 Tax=Rossellomorea aquimaris TaxID=189382 RepID=UPI001CFE17C7|nr:hypothetical protein [Rossellomorea aquimaris]